MEKVDLNVEEISGFYESMENETGQDGNGGPGGPDPSGGIGEEEAIRQLNKTLTNIVTTGHNVAVENGFKGLGDIPPTDYAELLAIVAKRNFSSVIIEKSPEVALASVTALIVLQNISGIRARKIKEQKNTEDES